MNLADLRFLFLVFVFRYITQNECFILLLANNLLKKQIHGDKFGVIEF